MAAVGDQLQCYICACDDRQRHIDVRQHQVIARSCWRIEEVIPCCTESLGVVVEQRPDDPPAFQRAEPAKWTMLMTSAEQDNHL